MIPELVVISVLSALGYYATEKQDPEKMISYYVDGPHIYVIRDGENIHLETVDPKNHRTKLNPQEIVEISGSSLEAEAEEAFV